VLYEPLDLIAKLAALVPRPRKNLVLYHGVLAAHAALRERVVSHGRAVAEQDQPPSTGMPSEPTVPRHKQRQWAELMRRAFGYDLLSCPDCGGKMALLACVLQSAAIRRILRHLRLPADLPALAPARASPDSDPFLDHVA
jgi:hypothetical protein